MEPSYMMLQRMEHFTVIAWKNSRIRKMKIKLFGVRTSFSAYVLWLAKLGKAERAGSID